MKQNPDGSLTQVGGEICVCPHCLKPQENVVQDYVIPGRVGDDSAAQDECWESACNKPFIVKRERNLTFSVLKTC